VAEVMDRRTAEDLRGRRCQRVRSVIGRSVAPLWSRSVPEVGISESLWGHANGPLPPRTIRPTAARLQDLQ
jgi:hypothetical protein